MNQLVLLGCTTAPAPKIKQYQIYSVRITSQRHFIFPFCYAFLLSSHFYPQSSVFSFILNLPQTKKKIKLGVIIFFIKMLIIKTIIIILVIFFFRNENHCFLLLFKEIWLWQNLCIDGVFNYLARAYTWWGDELYYIL